MCLYTIHGKVRLTMAYDKETHKFVILQFYVILTDIISE